MAREVKDNPRGAPVVDDGTTSDTLFPTVAVSDTINTLAHAYAAYVVLPVSMPAALGFALVALASAFGTLRFGFSPRIFRAGNDSLAELAAYVGLSLIGRAAATGPLSFLSTLDTTVFAVTLACVGAVARGLPKAVSDAVRTVVASSTFIIPVLVNGALRGDAVMVRRRADTTAVLNALNRIDTLTRQCAGFQCALVCCRWHCGAARAPHFSYGTSPRGLVSFHDFNRLGRHCTSSACQQGVLLGLHDLAVF